MARTLLIAVVSGLAFCWVFGDAVLPAELGVLHLAPFLALLLLLWRRRYPGEALIGRLRLAMRARRRRALSDAPVRLAPARVGPPRGSQLLGRALAVRPPPRAALTVLTF